LLSKFDEIIEVVLKHEGGLVDDPDDPGGLTNLGISQRAYPNEDIRGLTVERAKELYDKAKEIIPFWNADMENAIVKEVVSEFLQK